MRLGLFVFALLFTFFSFPEGFDGNTQVLTSDGYVSIKNLYPEDSVVCFDTSTVLSTGPSVLLEAGQSDHDSKQNSIIPGTVFGVSKYKAASVIVLSVENEKITAAKDQRFFSSDSMDWIIAEKVAPGDKLLSLDGSDVTVDSVELLDEEYDLLRISVESYNNFFVSQKNILAHNFLYNTVIEAASAVTARISMGVCPEVCNRIVALVSNAMPHIEKIFVAAFSAFLIKHKITEQEDDTSFGKKYGYAEEFYEESPFAYGASKDVIDRCDIVLDYFLKPTYSLAPILGGLEYAKVCAFSKNEIELQLKEKVLPRLLAVKKEFLKKQKEAKEKEDGDDDDDGDDGDDDDDEDDPDDKKDKSDKNKGKRQVKYMDRKGISGNPNEIRHMRQEKHGFHEIGIDSDTKAAELLDKVLDKVFQKGLNGELEIKENGTFKTTVECQGHEVGFKGMVLEGGEMKLGTTYLPEFYSP